MLQRHLTGTAGPAAARALPRTPGWCWLAVAAMTSLLPGCGSAERGEIPASGSLAIVGGSESDAAESPVLFLVGPEGACSAVLVGSRLALTVHHCVAHTMPGRFSCTASGDLMPSSNGGGQVGADDVPSSISFFTDSAVSQGGNSSAAAAGARIVDTQSPSVCRDDLAFVVLDRAIPGISPAPLRLTRPTQAGELVSVWGYGLTDAPAQSGLRVRSDVPILAVGPDTPSSLTQPAPVRAIRTGPVTCQGDSGGPFISEQTGAVVALVSLGSQAGTAGPYCSPSELTDTLGPRLGAYQTLAMQAFAASGDTPVAEPDPGADASAADAPFADAAAETSTDNDDASPDDASGSADDAPPDGEDSGQPGAEPESRRTLGPVDYHATGGASCAVQSGPFRGSPAALTWMLMWTAFAVGRRRR